MSESPVPRPLEGDALRIQQLKEKLAQAQHNQTFFTRGAAATSLNRPKSPLNLKLNTAPASSCLDRSSILPDDLISPGQRNADPFAKLNFRHDAPAVGSISAGSTRRQAPAIQPPPNRLTSEQKREPYHHFRLRSSTPPQVDPSTNSDAAKRAATSEVAPFMYQELPDGIQDRRGLYSPLSSPEVESHNPFDAPSLSHSATHLGTSSPLNPNKSASQQPLPVSNPAGRRQTVDPSVVALTTKNARGFFNNFLHKKKREDASANSRGNRPASDVRTVAPDQFTSPFEQTSRPQYQARNSTVNVPSFSALRNAPGRRQPSMTDAALRVKRSTVSLDRSPGTSISTTSGVVLDTDLSHISDIVRTVTDSSTLPKNDFYFKDARNTVASNEAIEDFGEAAWAPPESWAVRRPEDVGKMDLTFDEPDPLDDAISRSRKESHISALTNTSDVQAKRGPNHQMRIFRGDWTFATMVCGLHTTTESLMAILGRKFFLPSVANHQMLIERNGLSRVLQSWEKPFLLQKTLLEEAGYTEEDRLEELGREDNSYLCRFIFTTCSVPSFSMVRSSLFFRARLSG